MLLKCPEASDPRLAVGNVEIDRLPDQIDEEFLKKLHYKLKEAIISQDRSKA
jgi:hypothetical protein